ncbi:hypothetical protein V8C86DRAFT_2845510 [Haematococcus lacustris]
MTDPTEAADVVIWWIRLRAAPADEVKRAKELCTSGNLKRLANKSLNAFITLLDTGGPLLPPPGDVAASLLSGLCKCAHGKHVNNTNLEKLRDQCLDLLDLVLHLGHIGAFISTSRNSSELPKLPKEITRIMSRFETFLKEANVYCENYIRQGMMAGLSRFLLDPPEHKEDSFHSGHQEDFEELVTELRDLRADATLTLSVVYTGMTEEAKDKVNAGMPPVGGANSLELPAKPTEDTSCVGGQVQGGAQLFLSYRVPETGRKRHGGDRTVPLLKSALEAQGYSVFVGESDIEGEASWAQAIQVAITDCQVFIPVCSKTYGDTKWTLRELHAANEAKKEILALWHSGDYPPKPVSMYLTGVQRLPRGNQPLVQADFQSLVSDLVAAIKKVGGPAAGAGGGWWLQGLALDQGRRRI